MKSWMILLLFLFQWSSIDITAQSRDPVIDSLLQLNLKAGSPRQQVENLRALIWRHIVRIEDLSDLSYPGTLDSLYRCCIAGKTGDATYERELIADIRFFNASQLTHTDPLSAKSLIESAILTFRQLGDLTKEVLGCMQLSWTFSNLGDSIGFVLVREQTIKLLPDLKDPYIYINIQSTLGVGCYDFGMYAEAASHYFEALSVIESERTKELLNAQRDMFHNLGGVYARLGDLNNALLYVRKAIESAKETNQDTLDHYLILARILIARSDYKEALRALKQTENFDFVQANAIGMGQNAYSQATCYRQLGQLDSAIVYARKSVYMLPVSVNAQYGAAALLELATCEFELGMDHALQHADAALIALERAKYTAGVVEATALLSRIYKSRGDYLNALKYSELRFAYQNQIERLQSNRQLAFGEFSRENAAQQARREAEVKAELDRQRNIRYALYAGLGVFAFVAFLLFNRYRFKQRTTAQLQAKNAEVEAARLRAEKSEAFKSRFLANMSHEIRTPLHGITGFADLLQDTSLTEKQRRWVSAIHQSSLRLKDVVNDILDISKLEAGEVTLRRIPFSPEQVVNDVAETLQPKVAEKGIKLFLEIDPDISKAVLGDPTRLYQVLINLAGNAVKFTDRGGVTISMCCQVNTAKDEANILFSVKDTGIGIPPERLNVIFESFQQAEESTTAKFGGTGLGLTIARDLVRLHGSDIEVRSEVGMGSEFSFSLSWPMADATSLKNKSNDLEGVFDHPIHVLVVDDNAFNREISLEALHKHFENVTIDMAINGKEAVEKVAKQSFDIVLMDMQMPEMNGLEATKRIRQMTAEQVHVPIVALTASATPDEIQDALDAGMDRHLGKPFQPAELAKVIADVLHLKSKQKEPLPQVQDLKPVMNTDLYGYDLRFLRDFCNEDEEQVQYFLNKFQSQLPLELDRMETALSGRDHQQVYLVAHSFRPQLEFVGLNRAAIAMLQIEKGAKANQDMNELMDLFVSLKLGALC